MANDALKDYLRDVFKLESMLYSYRCVEAKYKEQLNALPRITENQLDFDKWYYMQGVEYKNTLAKLKSKRDRVWRTVALSFLGCYIPWVIFIYMSFINTGHRYRMGELIGWCIALAIPIPALIATIVACKIDNGATSDYDKFRWSGDGVNYNAWKQRQINEALEAKKPLIDHLKKQLEDDVLAPAKKVQDILDYMYSLNVLKSPYRKFIAVAQLYKYIDTGICSELTESSGAYSTYEQDVARGYIVVDPNQVTNQPKSVKERMSYAAGAIEKAEKLAKDATPVTDRMADNAALDSFNTECKARSEEIGQRHDY